MEFEEDSQRTVTSVWDWQLRILHWSNALLVISLALLILGKDGMELIGIEKSLRLPVKRLHAFIGHIFLVTFMLRIIWGFFGNTYSRWPDIIPYKKERWDSIRTNIKWYLSGFKGKPARAIGHDPLASLFYILLFLVIIGQLLTGVLLSGFEFKTFPGALITGGVTAASVKGITRALGAAHEFGMAFIIFFLAAHITGMVVHEIKEKNGLLSSMIHGRKYFTKE